MAAYKDLIGQKITKVTSNPGEPKTGQMWYNSTSGTLKGLGVLEAWSSASPTIVARDKRDYLWFMSRSSELSTEKKQWIYKKTTELGYDKNLLRFVPHN